MDRAQIALDLPALGQLIEEHRIGRTYGEHLLWLALLLTAVEFLYANRLMRGTRDGSDKVVVDAAGRVEIHVHAEA